MTEPNHEQQWKTMIQDKIALLEGRTEGLIGPKSVSHTKAQRQLSARIATLEGSQQMEAVRARLITVEESIMNRVTPLEKVTSFHEARMQKLEEQDSHHEVTRKMTVDLNNQIVTLRENDKSLQTQVDSLETAIRQLDSPRVFGQEDALDQRITLHLDKIHRELDGRLKDILSLNAQLDDVRNVSAEQDEGMAVQQKTVDILGIANARTHDRFAAVEGRLNSLVKAVEGFAQKQERTQTQLDAAFDAIVYPLQERVSAMQSWLSVTDRDLGLPTEARKAMEDMFITGRGVLKDGKRIDPHEMFEEESAMNRIRDASMDHSLDKVESRETLEKGTDVPESYWDTFGREAQSIPDREIHTHGHRPHKIVIYLD